MRTSFSRWKHRFWHSPRGPHLPIPNPHLPPLRFVKLWAVQNSCPKFSKMTKFWTHNRVIFSQMCLFRKFNLEHKLRITTESTSSSEKIPIYMAATVYVYKSHLKSALILLFIVFIWNLSYTFMHISRSINKFMLNAQCSM